MVTSEVRRFGVGLEREGLESRKLRKGLFEAPLPSSDYSQDTGRHLPPYRQLWLTLLTDRSDFADLDE